MAKPGTASERAGLCSQGTTTEDRALLHHQERPGQRGQIHAETWPAASPNGAQRSTRPIQAPESDGIGYSGTTAARRAPRLAQLETSPDLILHDDWAEMRLFGTLAPDPTPQLAGNQCKAPWQCLNRFPDPQGQAIFRRVCCRVFGDECAAAGSGEDALSSSRSVLAGTQSRIR